ncbi:tRNA (adenosine(37)-N6)-threonylcarbamoyltransferase complex ATPase subunit type 1 TsaE [Acetobacter orientalis]|uniref:tRNA (adenosine(37)-N6)-threonylcarbamoyltransferase complex ATPase subunit type 1 TsaE n=1 Tax=Acetobacter orientalis TaxID=146474 RepID=UPI0020A26A45|nr:tRNA (adenosine(37)-N6)-threonylcarbamoyltransferase complex ATPase subunit type 1 TsaE [Acetobacter orientalis]MCP1221969.1 tRNA (adenosine(37)-N6)-threonylcarbamoyltransferase complex ATPase subunit type 1 TsaE [Acetobacter orientalis]
MASTHLLHTEDATQDLARYFAKLARVGDVILLSGPLGAGKSVFARAFLRAVCQNPALEVPSPTYTLVQTYQAPIGALSHFDLWRLGGPDELEELGWDEAREGIVLVEWPERLEDLTPQDALQLTLTVGADGVRSLSVEGWQDRLPAAGVVQAP